MKLKVALYAASREGVGERLQQVIGALLPRKGIEVYRALDALLNRFRQPRDGLEIAVLLCERREELVSMIAMAHLFSDIRILLLLLDKSGIGLGEGHPLYPRFATHVSESLELDDVEAVLRKMLKGRTH